MPISWTPSPEIISQEQVSHETGELQPAQPLFSREAPDPVTTNVTARAPRRPMPLSWPYNTHRPHRSLEQRPPEAALDQPPSVPASVTMLPTTRCDGLINEYKNAA
ncbi:MAG: transposase [bacterium]|nr:transposase [bacterium]